MLWDGLPIGSSQVYQSDSGHLLRYREGGLSLLALDSGSFPVEVWESYEKGIKLNQTKMNGVGDHMPANNVWNLWMLFRYPMILD